MTFLSFTNFLFQSRTFSPTSYGYWYSAQPLLFHNPRFRPEQPIIFQNSSIYYKCYRYSISPYTSTILGAASLAVRFCKTSTKISRRLLTRSVHLVLLLLLTTSPSVIIIQTNCKFSIVSLALFNNYSNYYYYYFNSISISSHFSHAHMYTYTAH